MQICPGSQVLTSESAYVCDQSIIVIIFKHRNDESINRCNCNLDIPFCFFANNYLAIGKDINNNC